MNTPIINSDYLEYCSQQLMTQLLSNQGMEALVELGAGLLGNPIAVGTTRLTVLYTSKDMPPQVPMAKPGIISPDFSTDKSFIKYNEAAYYSDRPILTEEQYGGYKTLLMRTKIHGEITGYMSVLFCNTPYHPDIENVAILVRQTIECELAKHTSLLSKSQTASELLLIDILNNKTNDFSSNADAIIRLGLNKQTTFYLLVFNMIGFSKANMPGPDIKDKLQELTGAGLCTYYKENVVLLKQGSIRKLMPDIQHGSRLQKFMQKNGLCGGISFGSRQISDIPGCYKQAVLALSYAKNMDSTILLPYDHVVIPEFIKNTVYKHRLNYKLPEIRVIEAYDQSHGTNYRQVLKTFIENGKNASLTAASTGLSKSSVYRILDRIKTMTGLDFEHNDHLFAIYLGIKIEEY